MPDHRLQELETLRQQLEDLEHATDRLYDTLDRGHPDQEGALDAWRQIRAMQEKAGALKQQLAEQVAALRHGEPELLARWVARHQELCRQVQARYQGSDPWQVPEPALALHIARQGQADWAGVLSGERDYVIANPYLMDHHRDLSQQWLDFLSEPPLP